MDPLKQYRQIVQEVLTAYYQVTLNIIPPIERQLVFDTERDHYLLMNVGWYQEQRMQGCVIHIDIKDGQIWIQHDGTERGMANELVERGVPPVDIVLGFHAPYIRPYTGFGVEQASAESQAA